MSLILDRMFDARLPELPRLNQDIPANLNHNNSVLCLFCISSYPPPWQLDIEYFHDKPDMCKRTNIYTP